MDAAQPIPVFDLYGESLAFPDVLHCETIDDRAALHDWKIGVHRHVGLHQFFLLSRGEAELTADGARCPVVMPALINMPRLVAHGFRFARGTEGHVVSVPPAELPEVFGEGSLLASRLIDWAVLPATPGIAALVAAIAEEHRGAGFGRAAMLRGLAVQLAARAARLIGQATPRPVRPYAQHLAAFDALIAANLRRRWRAADYAAALGVTPTHLNRVTRAETGFSAARYVERHLFQEARRLLAYTRMNVGEIAWLLGFEDAAYFSRAFRRHMGEPPLRYRERFELSDT